MKYVIVAKMVNNYTVISDPMEATENDINTIMDDITEFKKLNHIHVVVDGENWFLNPDAVVAVFKRTVQSIEMSNHMNYRRRNPVAKFMNAVARPQTHRDRTQYKRKAKHRQRTDDVSY